MFSAQHMCGICRRAKKMITYSFKTRSGEGARVVMGIRTQNVHLCERCDLTGEPPL